MPRPPRDIPDDCVLHIINRRNDRQLLFAKPLDYQQFLSLLSHAKSKHPVRIIAYALMPNHWHLVIWVESSTQISLFMHWLTGTHAARVRWQTRTVGEGHVYQGRYRAFLIDGEARYFRLLQYVEANPLRARLVRRAEDWRWSSLEERLGRLRGLVEPGPIGLPLRWTDIVNGPLSREDLEDFRSKQLRTLAGAWDQVRRRRN